MRTATAQLGRLRKLFQLESCQLTSLAAFQVADLNGTDGDPFEAHDLVSQAGKHPPNLAVLTLTEDDLQPGAFALGLETLHVFRLHVAIAKPNAFVKLLLVL